jgi:tRNA/tmRNA/rRNA uracil-C5-methylase (TrmA/RlmC/RlmD family)
LLSHGFDIIIIGAVGIGRTRNSPLLKMDSLNQAFELSFLKFDESKYEEIFVQKCFSFLSGINGANLKPFTPTLQMEIEEVQNSRGLSITSIENCHISIIPSPTKHCRQRIRFAVRPIPNEDLGQYQILRDPKGSRKDEITSVILDSLCNKLDTFDIDNHVEFPVSLEENNHSLLHYVMWEDGSPSILVKDFPLASEQISFFMPIILNITQRYSLVGNGIKAIHFLSSTIGEIIISFLYDSPLDEVIWTRFMELLRSNLFLEVTGDCKTDCQGFIPLITKISFIGKSKKQKIVIGDDFIMEKLVVTPLRNNASNHSNPTATRREFFYKQIDEGFCNPNPVVNMRVLDWLSTVITSNILNREEYLQSDLLEMYCGNGNHTVVLSRKYYLFICLVY